VKWRWLLTELATTRLGSVGDEAQRRAKLVPTIFLEFEKLATQMTKFALDCSTAATMFAVCRGRVDDEADDLVGGPHRGSNTSRVMRMAIGTTSVSTSDTFGAELL
jgi:hypothetical protein